MLFIETGQFKTLGQEPQARFVTDLAQRLSRFWPEEAEAFGPERTLQVTQQAVQRALALGFETELDVARFAHLVFALHSVHFAEQEWAKPYLQGPLPPRERMNRLFDAAVARMAQQEAQQP